MCQLGKQSSIRKILSCMTFGLLLMLIHGNISALSAAEASAALNDAALQLVRFCMDPKVGLNDQAVATLVDHVLTSKESKEAALAKSQDCSGAYYEFDTKI